METRKKDLGRQSLWFGKMGRFLLGDGQQRKALTGGIWGHELLETLGKYMGQPDFPGNSKMIAFPHFPLAPDSQRYTAPEHELSI